MVKLLTSVAAIAAISHLVTATATGATNDNDASVKRHRQRRHQQKDQRMITIISSVMSIKMYLQLT